MSHYFLCSQNKDSINNRFFQMLAAKQNQKSPFHFLSAPPTPPAEEKKKGKENFWVLLPRPKGADEARRIRAYDLVSLHHARGACNIFCFEKRYELSTINTPERKSQSVLIRLAEFILSEIEGLGD